MSLNQLGANHSFLRLEDLLLPPPLPAIVSVLIVLGILNLSMRGSRWLKTENTTPIELAAVFVITTGLLSALVHALAWAGHASIPVLRVLAWLLVAFGILEVGKFKVRKLASLVGEYWRYGSRVERCALTVSILALTGVFAAALGPVTDMDSLDYHLAVPLDWLRHGGAYPRPDWFTARYVGLGESLNMLGLAAGTDGLGATFQAAGLVVAVIGVTAFARTRPEQVFAILLVTVPPIIVSLVAAQKWQLFPAAALTTALVIIVQRFRMFDLTTALLAFGCAAFAMASKHSCLLPGGVVVFLGLVAAVRAQRLRIAFWALAGCFAVLVIPVLARNFVFYGDPLSPLLERWRPGGDPAVIAFAQSLRTYAGHITLGRFLSRPWELAIPLKSWELQDGLGLGVFGFLLALRERGATRQLLLAALAAFVLLAAFSQLKPRFFLEPYLWSAAATAGAASAAALRSFF